MGRYNPKRVYCKTCFACNCVNRIRGAISAIGVDSSHIDFYLPTIVCRWSDSSFASECRLVARVNTVAFQGIDVIDVDVQVQIAAGLPAFTILFSFDPNS